MIKLPDWSDAAQYPNPRRVSNQRLAWEFLRRNPGYLESWHRYETALRVAAGNDPALSRYVDCMTRRNPDDAAWLAALGHDAGQRLDRRLHEHPALTVIEQTGERSERRTPLAIHEARQWGIEQMRSPSGSAFMEFSGFKGDVLSTEVTGVGLVKLEALHGGPLSLRQTRWLVLQIDLALPLNVLEERLLHTIRSVRRWRAKQGHLEPMRQHARGPALLVEYLRILDARAGRKPVPFSKIGEVLRPREANHAPEYTRNHRMRAAHKEAVRIRDAGYRILPLVRDRNVKLRMG